MKLYEPYNKKFGITIEQVIDDLGRQGIHHELFAYCTVRGRRFRFRQKQFTTKIFDGHEVGGYELTGYYVLSASGPLIPINHLTVQGIVDKEILSEFIRDTLRPWFNKDVERKHFCVYPPLR